MEWYLITLNFIPTLFPLQIYFQNSKFKIPKTFLYLFKSQSVWCNTCQINCITAPQTHIWICEANYENKFQKFKFKFGSTISSNTLWACTVFFPNPSTRDQIDQFWGLFVELMPPFDLSHLTHLSAHEKPKQGGRGQGGEHQGTSTGAAAPWLALWSWRGDAVLA